METRIVQQGRAAWERLKKGRANYDDWVLVGHALIEGRKVAMRNASCSSPAGESTVQEKTLGLLPNPLQKYGIKFAATYIGETLGNVSGGIKRGAVYEGRLNLAVDVDLQKLVGAEQLTSPTCSRSMAAGFREAPCRTCSSSAASKPCPRRDCKKRILRNSGGQNWFRSSWASSPPTANFSIRNTRTSSRTHRWDGLPSLRSTFRAAAHRHHWRPWEPACSST